MSVEKTDDQICGELSAKIFNYVALRVIAKVITFNRFLHRNRQTQRIFYILLDHKMILFIVCNTRFLL